MPGFGGGFQPPGASSGAAAVHSHAEADVTSLVADLAAKVDSANLSELVDDRVAALLTAGANVTITYNDAAGTLTITAAGSLASAYAFGG